MTERASGRHPKPNAGHIAFSLINAIAQQRVAPGMRLGEEDLAAVFGVSRTTVRQALTQLAAQGFLGVKPKKGWFVIEPSAVEVRDVFAARRLVEGALMREFVATAGDKQLRVLKSHLHRQHGAIAGDDVALRTHLLTDFHIQIAEMMGNVVVTRILRDLTFRTNLIATLYQSNQDASHSAEEHDMIVAAIEARDGKAAVRLMGEHLHNVEAGLRHRKASDPVARLRDALGVSAMPPPAERAAG